MKSKKLIPVDNLKKDITRQPNEFTNAIFKGSALAYKMILFALYRTVQDKNPIEPNKKNVYCGFSKNEFCEKLGIPIGSKTLDLINKATDELAESFLTLENSDNRENKKVWLRKLLWFQRVDVMGNGDVCLKFNQEIADFFDFKIGYTAFELLEIGNLRSFYAMRYYGFAKSKSGFLGTQGNKKNEWWFELTEDEIRKLFEIEKEQYLERRDFVKGVIKNPCEEINKKTNIKIDLEYEKQGKGKYKWRFICSNKIEYFKNIKKIDSRKLRDEKREINNEIERVSKLKAKYPERWQEVFDFEMSQPCLFGGEKVKKTFAENKADLTLFQEFGDELN